MREISVIYSLWKSLVSGKMPTFFIPVDNGYSVLSSGDTVYIWTGALGSDATDFETYYKSSSTLVNNRDEALLRGMVAAKAPLYTIRDADGTEKVIHELRSDSRYTVVTHNFSDKCSWYQESTRVTDEALTTDSERKAWSSAHTFWVDLKHGRVSDENDFSSPYIPVVKVDGMAKVEAIPFGDGTDGDFVIDYETGVVTFHAAIDPASSVTATYSYAGSSIFTIAPTAGKLIRLFEAECQMSEDIIMNDSLWYGIYVTIPGVGELLVKQKMYKTIQDIINEANGAYPIIPAMGGTKRGTPHTTITFPWHYVSRTDLKSSLSMKIKIKLPNNDVCGGHSACVAFYCVSMTE